MTPDLSHRQILRAAGAFYLVLAVAGAVWIGGRDGTASFAPHRDWEDLALAAALGIAAGLGVVVVWRLLAALAPGLREFEDSLAPLFSGMGRVGVAWLALVSSVGEEIFFRGGMQRSWGILVASLAFGMLHFPIRREMAPWPVFAALLGFGMGALYELTDTLLAPIATHFTVNFVHLGRLAAIPPPADDLQSGESRAC